LILGADRRNLRLPQRATVSTEAAAADALIGLRARSLAAVSLFWDVH